MGAADPGAAGPQGRCLTATGAPGAVDVVQRIEASLATGGFKMTRDSVAGRQAVIGRQSTFRLRWVATRLHVFVLVAVFKSDATPEHLDRFLEEASQYAITLKGRLRGLQSGTCAVAVAVVDSAERAGEWAVKPHGRRFAAMTYPVLVDLANKRVVRPERMLIGAVYVPYLRQLVKAHVESSLQLV